MAGGDRLSQASEVPSEETRSLKRRLWRWPARDVSRVFQGFSMVFKGFSMVFKGVSMVFKGFSMVFWRFLEVFCYLKPTKKHGTFGGLGRDVPEDVPRCFL